MQPDSHEVPDSKIPVKFEGLTFKALLDTGATVNAIGPKILKKYPRLRKYKCQKEVITQSATTACSKKKIELNTVVTVNVEILHRNFQVTFYVVPDLQNDFILGIPFFQQAEIQIGYDKDAMYVTFNSTLRLEKSLTIPPLLEYCEWCFKKPSERY